MDGELKAFGFTVNIVLTVLASVLVYLYAYWHHWVNKEENELTVSKLLTTKLPDLPPIKLNLDQLLGFDGTRSDGRILVALRGKIYDVSSDFEEFGLTGTLSHVAGRDFTNYLNSIMDMHNSEINYVDRWESILETNYSCVGEVIDEQGNPLMGKLENHNADVVEETEEDMMEPINTNEKSMKTLNEVLNAETLPSDNKSEKCSEEPNSEIRIHAEISDC
ncbi:membrane-associated progesterone receptor component 2 [Drosophila sechellia]|uniref:GM26141 n=1 Tax=Drosophila sechellia TaxID=7238 RepID=B4IEA2_DROSE|nr:membrane-associated progesterone receptor component 2 [Drosophila sechellia]EDW45929.1 GM26141 [Drosophila sechellia]